MSTDVSPFTKEKFDECRALIEKGELFYFGEPKVLGKWDFPKRKDLEIVKPEAQKDADGNCIHVNKCWYNLYVKMPTVFYARFCSDCNKILTPDGTAVMPHAKIVKEIEESVYGDDEKKQLLANFEELNGCKE